MPRVRGPATRRSSAAIGPRSAKVVRSRSSQHGRRRLSCRRSGISYRPITVRSGGGVNGYASNALLIGSHQPDLLERNCPERSEIAGRRATPIESRGWPNWKLRGMPP